MSELKNEMYWRPSVFNILRICILSLLLGSSITPVQAQPISNQQTIQLRPDLPTPILDDKSAEEWLLKTLGKKDFSWIKISEKTDDLEFRHVKYRQVFNNIPVFGSELVFHYNFDGLYFVNGKYQDIKTIKNSAELTKSKALNLVMGKYPSNQYNWECEDSFSEQDPKLWIYESNGNYYYAFRVDIYSVKPLFRYDVFIDAEEGKDLGKLDKIHHADVTGSGNTMYHGQRSFTTDAVSETSYRLQNTIGGGINTVDMNSGTSIETDFTDSDNIWTSTTNDDHAAHSVHWGVEQTYNYFSASHSFNSFDDNDALIKSRVHYDLEYNNAFWDGSQLTFGDGNGAIFNPLVSIDIVGHEFTHGVVQNTAGLVYSYESGALNESFADVFGYCVRFYADSANTNFYIGDLVTVPSYGAALRNMANPNEFGDPDTYNGTNWHTSSSDNGGVHTNSGVQNYWFYLLVNGASGTNDLGDAFNISSIGVTKAAKIAFRSLSLYLTSSSNYLDARSNSIQAATDLYGSCSNEVIQVTNAWYAVGVGDAFQNSVTANFIANTLYSCSTPLTVTFTNNSTNNSTNIWDFGDGTTSTAVSPVHTYTTAGNYDVRLIVNGSSSCGGAADTLLITDYITLDNSIALTSASCNSSVVSSYYSYIQSFTFDSLVNTVNSSSVIQDLTCNFNETVMEGVSLPIEVNTTGSAQYKQVWIDFDNSGAFSASEKIYDVYGFNTIDSIIIDEPGIVYNTPLRLRVVVSNSILNSACATNYYGQQQDYRITIVQNTNPPIAQFSTLNNITTVGANSDVNFLNESLNIPTSYTWYFPGAVPSTSTLENPIVSYNATGLYDVTLVVSNTYGSDSITVSDYISVINEFYMCTNDSTNASSGTLYDQGGPNGNYNNGSNCSFLIEPGCASSVTLSFTNFQTESCCDRIRVYDGTDNTGTLLLTQGGNSIPSSVTANSGSMYVEFYSDGSVTGSGFHATWTSVIPTTPPVSGITLADTNLYYNVPTQFTDASTNLIQSWYWDFGDGTVSQDQNPIKAYTTSGTYEVQLITDNCFALDTAVQTILVQTPPLTIINPDTVFATVDCSDTTSGNFIVYNNGTGDMVVNINETLGGDSLQLLMLKYSSYNTNYFNIKTNIQDNNSSIQISEYDSWDASGLEAALIDKDVFIIPPTSIGTYFLSNIAPILEDFVTNGGQVVMIGAQNYKVTATGLLNSTSDYYVSNTNAFIVGTHETVNGLTLPLQLSNAYGQTFSDIDYEPLIQRYQYQTGNNHIYGYKSIGDGNVYYLGSDFYYQNTTADEVLTNLMDYLYENTIGWIDMTTSLDTITPADSIVYNFNIDASNLYAGQYLDSILVSTNDSLLPEQYVYVSLDVLGHAVISVNNVVNFDTIQQTTFTTDTFIVENIGCDTLFVDSISFTNGSFMSDINTLHIPPYSLDTLILTFSSDSVFSYTDSMFINYNDTLETIVLNGVSIGAPILSYSIQNIIDTAFHCGDSVVVPVTVYNTGEGNLNGTIDVYDWLGLNDGSAFYEGFEAGNFDDWTAQYNSQYFSVVNTNPSDGLYCLKSEHSTYGNAEMLRDFNTNEDYIRFKMRSDYSSSNGSSVSVTSTGGSISIFQVSKQYNNYVVHNGTSTYYHPITNHNLWTTFEIKNIDYINKTFDLAINGIVVSSNLNFYSNYYTPSRLKIHTGSNYNYEAQYFDDIQVGDQIISDWATTSVDTMNIIPGDSLTFDVVLNSEGLITGNYNAYITFNTNDPSVMIDTIPVSFTVLGSSEINTDVSCVQFPLITQYTSVTDSFMVFNTGCDTLFLNSLQTSLSDFIIAANTDTIVPGDTTIVHVTFTPSTIGSITDTLLINTDDTIVSICLSGNSEGAPEIVVTPNQITHNITSCTDSINVDFWIYNVGLDTLFWELGAGTNYSDDFESYTLNPFWDYNYSVYVSPNCGAASGTKALRFYGSGNREIRTIGMTVSLGSSIDLKIKKGGICESPEQGEDIKLAYSLDNGSTWVPFHTFLSTNSNYDNFYLETIAIPNSAASSNTKFKIYQTTHSGSSYDVWTIDDFSMNTTTLSTGSDILMVGDSVFVQASLYVGGLTNGQHIQEVLIASNDPLNPISSVICTLNVSSPPCGDFTFDQGSSCSGDFTFTSTSENSVTSWEWNFGDGNNSFAQNPTHTYTTVGNYVVALYSCNTNGCDTIEYTVNVSSLFGPNMANCTPGSIYTYTNRDISFVSLGNISNTSSGVASGFEDFTCTDSTTLMEGQSYPMVIETMGGYNKNVIVWIDFNNDGNFSITEKVFEELNGASPHSNTIVIPNTAVTDQPLRMRVGCDRSSYTVNSCTDVRYGQFEDYTVFIKSSDLPPVAEFTINELIACNGLFEFTDQSLNTPTSWLWNFGDGNTSQVQNPSYMYTEAGIFTVKLYSTNAFGTDSLSQNVIVKIAEADINILSPLSLGGQIQFSNGTSNIVSYDWSFGDGGTSSDALPLHAYTNPQLYIVSLTATNSYGCSTTVYDTVDLTPFIGVSELDNERVNLYPNPTNGTVNIKNNLDAPIVSVEVYSSLGKLMKQYKFETYKDHIQLDLSTFESGLYTIRSILKDERYSIHKVILEK